MLSRLLPSPQAKWTATPDLLDADALGRELPHTNASWQARVMLQGYGESAEEELDTDVDVEAAEQCLIPRPQELRQRMVGIVPLAAAVVLLVCSVLFFNIQRPLSIPGHEHVSLISGPVAASEGSALAERTMQTQPFVRVLNATLFKPGDAVILDQGMDGEEVHKVEESHIQTGVLRFHHGLLYTHEEGSPVVHTPEVTMEYEVLSNYLFSRDSVSMAFGTTADDTQVKLHESCDRFEVGDEVELSGRQTGHYEFNMVTGVTFDEADRTCLFHLAYPVVYSHSSHDQMSKMVLAPLPSPEDPVLVAKDICDLDANGDAKITKKEALVDPEVAARIPCLDEDGDGVVSAKQCASYTSLDSDGEGCISEAEASKDQCVRDKFSDWDEDGDGCLSQKELENAALSRPQIALVIKNIDYAHFSADTELLESKRQQSEDLIAGSLDKVDDEHVLVKLSAGSLRIDAYIDGEASQVETLKKKIQGELLTLFTDDPAMQPYIDGEEDEVKPAVDTGPGPGNGLIVAMVACLLTLLAVALCCRPLCSREKNTHPKWELPLDMIVVPGGGLGKDGALPPWVRERLKVAKQIYDDVNQSKAQQEAHTGETRGTCRLDTIIVTMCEGIRFGPKDPQGTGAVKMESQQAADFLMNLGVKAKDIITDDFSLDTVGNAYFLRTTDSAAREAQDIVVVTNDFHMDRTKAIFNKVFDLPPFRDPDRPRLKYKQAEYKGVGDGGLEKRKDWEHQQRQEFERISRQWTDLYHVHSAIFPDEAVPENRAGSFPRSFTRSRSLQDEAQVQ